jgi:hypothetical protein
MPLKRSSSAISLFFFAFSSFAQTPLSDRAIEQIRDVLRAKRTMRQAQKKESSAVSFAVRRARREATGVLPDAAFAESAAADGTIVVDLKADRLGPVQDAIVRAGGQVLSSFEADGELRARVPVLQTDTVAALAGVKWVRAADIATTNVGSITSQGFVTHTADQANKLGFDGTGVKVGVLSDSASSARVAALIASGDLPGDTIVVPGQAGTGTDEGTAIMEIVHDLAPGAKLFFATANGGQANFANNIRTLRFTYGCDIIVDDITYFAEGAFQDGTIARAVNDVTASGALYFSAAANSGNFDSGTSGTWEGDFNPDGNTIPVFGQLPVVVHNFGSPQAPLLSNVLTGAGTGGLYLKWSDPLGGSTNDYDLFVFDSSLTVLKGLSVSAQTGTQDPLEIVPIGSNCGTTAARGYCPAVGDQIVVVLFSGSPRALRLETERGRLSIATAGASFGHNAGSNTISMAATYWNSAHTGTMPFTGLANPIETFSSDGPRKIFFAPNGTAITPNNFLFGTGGGITLQKPDLTAADGIFTKTPGFLPFFGTSAAAPHAAAIAALVKGANPALTNQQIKQILTQATVDNMAPGADRDAGYGIVMALEAVFAAVNP